MNTLGTFHSMRQAADQLDSDSRTVQLRVAQLGIPSSRIGKMIVIDEAGLDRLREIYAEARNRPARSA